MRIIAVFSIFALAGCPWPVSTPPGGGGTPDPGPAPSLACVAGGCSSQLCIEEGSGGISTCEWLAEYACYQDLGECARQADGECGWTESTELLECLEDPSVLDDCRRTGCGTGQYCTFCWVNYACIPDGAVC